MTGRFPLVLVAAVVALAAACAGGASSEPVDGWGRQTAEVGRVEIQATPIVLDDASVEIRLVFNTHAVELDNDVAATSTLVVGDRQRRDGTWDGDGPGGHHRDGVLRFGDVQAGDGPLELHLDGLGGVVVFRWLPPQPPSR